MGSWDNQKHVSESFYIKGIALLVHLESYVMLLIGNSSLELLHVDGRDTCCDQEGWIKRSESENIQSNLKGTLRIRVLHHIANSDCEGLLRIRDLKDIANSDTIGFIENSYPKLSYL
ncbi:hypothetical protein Tco_0431076 [Tanacetum coccineum]